MNKKGFTLVEILIAMFVGLVIMAAVYGLMTFAQKTSSSLDRKVITQQDTRSVLDLMAMEIRMVSYNMRSEPLIWAGNGTAALPGIPTCWVNPIINVNKGIQIANANTLVFAMDLDSDGQFTSNNEYIRYSYNGADTLSRATNCAAPQNILGGTAPFTNVRNFTEGVLMFRYFSATGEMGGLTGVPMDIRAIRRILITIATETEQPDSNTHQPKRMVYSTNVIVRNHVLSPPHPIP